MADPFESAWLKWAGGVVESHVLADNVNALRQQGNLNMPISFWTEYDPKRHCLVYSVVGFESPFPPYWGVMLGNIVHNYRCALDHIAWTLYKRGRTPNLPEHRERQVYFPVTRSRTHFNNVLAQKLPGARRADVAKVRAVQPWRAGTTRLDRHVLWVLEGLAQEDKHRSLRPVAPVPDSTGIGVGFAKDCIYRRMGTATPRKILEPGTELVRLYVKKTGPDPHIDVQPHFTLNPSINARLTLEQFLLKTRDALLRLLYAFADPPDSIAPILGGKPQRPK
jgi:hypothetical protein